MLCPCHLQDNRSLTSQQSEGVTDNRGILRQPDNESLNSVSSQESQHKIPRQSECLELSVHGMLIGSLRLLVWDCCPRSSIQKDGHTINKMLSVLELVFRD